MIRPEYLEALGDLGYSQQESRFLYLAATHSGYFTLRQFLDFTGTAKGWNVHQFTSKSIRLGHLRAATCGYRTSVFNLYSRKVYGALDRDNLRNRRRLSNELIRIRLLILDFVLAHAGLEYLETEAEKVAYFRELAVPEALIPGRVYKGIDPNSTTKRCFVDRFPVFFSAESDCPPGELTPTFVYCDSANRGLFRYITHLRHYEHFLRRLSGFYFVYAASSSVKFHRAEQFFRSTFEENSAANVRSIARYFRVRRLWDENKHSLLTRADRDLLRYGNQRYRDEFLESVYRKWAAGGTEEQALEALLGATRRHRSGDSTPISCPVTTTFSEANPVWIAERQIPRIVLYLVLHPVLTRRSLSTSRPRNTRWNTDKDCTRQKPFHGRARPHFPRPYAGQIPFGASGVTPGRGIRAALARSVFCRVPTFKVVPGTLQTSFVERVSRPQRKSHASTEIT